MGTSISRSLRTTERELQARWAETRAIVVVAVSRTCACHARFASAFWSRSKWPGLRGRASVRRCWEWGSLWFAGPAQDHANQDVKKRERDSKKDGWVTRGSSGL